MKKKQTPETREQVDLRLSQVLPYTWEVLQHIPFPDTIWEKVNTTDPDDVGPFVDTVEDAAKVLARKLRVSPKQAALILLETCFQRLD